LIAIKPEYNINFGSDCGYLNTTQISAKSEGKCLKVSLANLFRIVNIETENITCPDWKYYLPGRTSMTENWLVRPQILLVNTSEQVDFLRV